MVGRTGEARGLGREKQWLLSWLPDTEEASLALLGIFSGGGRAALTVGDLVRLSLLLVDEDDGDEDDDLGHDAQEGPQGGQAAAHTQLDLGCGHVSVDGTLAHVVAHVGLHV